jgi:hypothetical protein
MALKFFAASVGTVAILAAPDQAPVELEAQPLEASHTPATTGLTVKQLPDLEAAAVDIDLVDFVSRARITPALVHGVHGMVMAPVDAAAVVRIHSLLIRRFVPPARVGRCLGSTRIRHRNEIDRY